MYSRKRDWYNQSQTDIKGPAELGTHTKFFTVKVWYAKYKTQKKGSVNKPQGPDLGGSWMTHWGLYLAKLIAYHF